jgi:predicted enzyme related to lactoylglutathione lyase
MVVVRAIRRGPIASNCCQTTMKGFAVMVSTVASRYALAYAMLAVVACNEGPNNGRTAVRADAADTSSAEESMSQAEQDRRVDYIEFTATDIERTKQFYSEVFGWEFTDYGPDYSSFSDGRLAGGFTVAAEVSAGGPLVVLYSTNLEEIATRIRDNGGQIVREIFEFPGGRRFHFTDPSGNELAVWSDR